MSAALPSIEARRDVEDSDMHADSSLMLLRQARLGDWSALEVLRDLYLPALRRWAGDRVAPSNPLFSQTDDVFWEAVVQTFERFESLEPRREGTFHAHLRQATLQWIHDQFSDAGDTTLGPTGETGVAGTSRLEAAIGVEALRRYELALQTLDDVDREGVIARIELGLSYEAVAEALGKPSVDITRLAVKQALVRLALSMNRDDI